jgi:hypothetical protein
MASRAEGDEIFLGIGPRLAAKLFVVNFKIGHRSARLASPAVASEHLVAKLFIQLAVQALAWLFWSDAIHEAFSVA